MKRRILFSVMCAVITASVFAQGQGQGLAGINAATSLMTSYFDPATKLCYAIGAVLGLVAVSRPTASSPVAILIPRRQPPAGFSRDLSDRGRHHPAFLLPLEA